MKWIFVVAVWICVIGVVGAVLSEGVHVLYDTPWVRWAFLIGNPFTVYGAIKIVSADNEAWREKHRARGRALAMEERRRQDSEEEMLRAYRQHEMDARDRLDDIKDELY